MKKEEARKKFGNDVFYKLVNPNSERILVVTNNKDFVEKEKKHWDSIFKMFEDGFKATVIEKVDFDTAYDSLFFDHLIIRRFYEHE